LFQDSRTLMRPSRGLPLRFQAALVILFLIAVLFPASAQNSNPLPPQWNDAVRKLADKIAADVSPLKPLSLEVKNISPLSAAETAHVHGALADELKNRSFLLASPSTAAGELVSTAQVTVSWGTDGYVLVAEIQSGSETKNEPQVAIVSAPKLAPGANQTGGEILLLQKRLIWQQPDKFLDFLVWPLEGSGSASQLAVLEPRRLAYYNFQDAGWRLSRSIPILRPTYQPRNLDGFFEKDGTRLYLNGIACTGELAEPETVKCKGTGAYENRQSLPSTAFEGVNVRQAMVFESPCEGHGASLETGTGDWTETDTIQGSQSTNDNFSESGAPIGTDGPVLTLVPGSASGTARIVVHNLKSGEYEGYIVTATCSR
jgi:hypothetical protein